MPLKIRCLCGRVLVVPANRAGTRVKCPKCEQRIGIPHLVSESPEVPLEADAVLPAAAGNSPRELPRSSGTDPIEKPVLPPPVTRAGKRKDLGKPVPQGIPRDDQQVPQRRDVPTKELVIPVPSLEVKAPPVASDCENAEFTVDAGEPLGVSGRLQAVAALSGSHEATGETASQSSDDLVPAGYLPPKETGSEKRGKEMKLSENPVLEAGEIPQVAEPARAKRQREIVQETVQRLNERQPTDGLFTMSRIGRDEPPSLPKPPPIPARAGDYRKSPARESRESRGRPAGDVVLKASQSESPDRQRILKSPASAAPNKRVAVTQKPGMKPNREQARTVKYLGLALVISALFGALPGLLELKDHLRAMDSPGVTVWANIQFLACTLQLVYAFYLVQVPDWSSVWVVSCLAALLTAIYAMLLVVALLADDQSQIIALLELNAFSQSGKVAGWCFVMLLIVGLLAYFSGKIGQRWQQAYENRPNALSLSSD